MTRPRQSVVAMVDMFTKKLNNNSRKWLIHPQSKRMTRWDICMGLMLLFVALIAPFEIAFLKWDLESTRGVTLYGALLIRLK